MSSADVPLISVGSRGFIRWICTNNPFYVLSAGLFFLGLRVSFDMTGDEAWAMLGGLTGYIILLAATGIVLVRFGRVWDDARTVLLLIVLMMVAASVTLDELLVVNRTKGAIGFLLGLVFAIGVSEAVLRGIRIGLPAGFRLPYYFILSLFFLYPLALSPLLDQPHSEELMWGLFGFSTVASLAFLTLLPAIRRGPEYVRDNGSPWPWPLYPWSLFAFLALSVPGRAFLLCWSLHLLDISNGDSLIFGPYFLVPFGFALAVLLLEMGLVSRHAGAQSIALLAPVGLALLAAIGHRPDSIFQEFLEIFIRRLGGDPLYVTLILSVAFYAYATARQVSLASEALTAALAALAIIGSDTLSAQPLNLPAPTPILLAALLQLELAFYRRNALHALVGAACLVAFTVLLLPDNVLRLAIGFHLTLLTVWIFGAFLRTGLGEFLRNAGVALVTLGCCLTAFLDVPLVSPDAVWLYPPAIATLLLVYGIGVGHSLSFFTALAILASWLVVMGWRLYRILQEAIVGLDYLALSFALFVLAIAVSLTKTGRLSRWIDLERPE